MLKIISALVFFLCCNSAFALKVAVKGRVRTNPTQMPQSWTQLLIIADSKKSESVKVGFGQLPSK
jgi:hypothetical protein